MVQTAPLRGHVLAKASWLLALTTTTLAVVLIGAAAAFTPLTMPQQTNLSPKCLACAFIADQLQHRLPTVMAIEAASGSNKGDRVTVAENVDLKRKLAVAARDIAEALIKDGWTYHVDENRVLLAPEDEALRKATPPPADLDHEPASIIIARTERRRRLGMRPYASPWSSTVLADFVRTELAPRVASVLEAPNPFVGSNVTREEFSQQHPTLTDAHVHAATQSNEDGAHASDLFHALAAFVDTVLADRRRPPRHFLARLVCVVELTVCPDAGDVAALEAIEATFPDQKADADREWRNPRRPGFRHPQTQDGAEDDETAFTPAFIHRLSVAVKAAQSTQAPEPRKLNNDDL